jgi:hypothetical protein
MNNYSDTVIHANSRELDVLDFIQGGTCRLKGNPNVRIYAGEMERMLENPDVTTAILHFARKGYAKGGQVGVSPLSQDLVEQYRMAGRNGDNCLAVVGPRLKAFLDMLAEHKGTTNPDTNLPEYFSLGGIFNSIGSGLSGLASNGMGMLSQFASPLLKMGGAALPMLGQLAGTALGSRFGPMGASLGSQFGGMLGGMGGNMMNQFAGQQQPSPYDQYGQSAGQNMGEMAQNMYGGMSPQMAAGNAMSNFGQQNFGNSGFGGGLQAAGNAFAGGASPFQAAGQFAQNGGMQPMIDRARQAMGGMFGGGQQQQQYPQQQQFQPQYG